jgi:hypothetical protein
MNESNEQFSRLLGQGVSAERCNRHWFLAKRDETAARGAIKSQIFIRPPDL